jgi:hypothetical protein
MLRPPADHERARRLGGYLIRRTDGRTVAGPSDETRFVASTPVYYILVFRANGLREPRCYRRRGVYRQQARILHTVRYAVIVTSDAPKVGKQSDPVHLTSDPSRRACMTQAYNNDAWCRRRKARAMPDRKPSRPPEGVNVNRNGERTWPLTAAGQERWRTAAEPKQFRVTRGYGKSSHFSVYSIVIMSTIHCRNSPKPKMKLTQQARFAVHQRVSM